ncbi:hypothetical protein D3C86_1837720 [compost metagenome]
MLVGLSLKTLSKSSRVLNSDSLRTASTLYSVNSRAIGVTSFKLICGLFCSMAVTMIAPTTSSAFGSPLVLLANCASPRVPPAPPLFSKVVDFAALASTRALPSTRAVWS